MIHALLLFARDVYGQFLVFFMDTFINRPFLHILSKVEIVNHQKLTKYIEKRPKGVPLITVSNHCSSLDEPLLFSALIPWPIKQWKLRYSLCNDDMFFSLGEVFAQLFFYASRGIPIWRTRSMNQPTFKLFCAKAAAGGWCHIFPEGRIWQPWKLRREGRVLGPLRPGVGKLIAHCEGPEPVVVPFFHTGMHRVLPQYPGTRRQSLPPKTGSLIRIRVGDPIPVADILTAHADRRRAARAAAGTGDELESTEADEEVYALLTRRVEEALTRMAQATPLLPSPSSRACLPGGPGPCLARWGRGMRPALPAALCLQAGAEGGAQEFVGRGRVSCGCRCCGLRR